MPLALFYKLFDFFEQRGRVFFRVFIQRYLVVAENVIKFFGKVFRALKRR